jgi:hypothetical protein
MAMAAVGRTNVETNLNMLVTPELDRELPAQEKRRYRIYDQVPPVAQRAGH